MNAQQSITKTIKSLFKSFKKPYSTYFVVKITNTRIECLYVSYTECFKKTPVISRGEIPHLKIEIFLLSRLYYISLGRVL